MDRSVVFLCHASEDEELAERIGRALMASGIETFFSPWSIRPGDSLRQKIDEGLHACTHFLVLLTPRSLAKPWVTAEIDAGFVKKVSGEARFIPIRYGVAPSDMPPLLQPLLSPKVEDSTFQQDIDSLIGDIHGYTRKPPLGEVPRLVRPGRRQFGLSPAALAIATLLSERSELGRAGDPEIPLPEILEATSLSIDDLGVAVDELESLRMVKPVRALGCPPHGYHSVEAAAPLFLALDPQLRGCNPRADASRLVTDLINSGRDWLDIGEAAERLGWEPRRMNPALYYLQSRNVVLMSQSIDRLYLTSAFTRNSRTLRFARDSDAR